MTSFANAANTIIKVCTHLCFDRLCQTITSDIGKACAACSTLGSEHKTGSINQVMELDKEGPI